MQIPSWHFPNTLERFQAKEKKKVFQWIQLLELVLSWNSTALSKCRPLFFRKKNPLSLFLLKYSINISPSLLTHTHTHTRNVLFLEDPCAFILCLRNLLLCCWQWGWQVPHTVCTALFAAPEHDNDVFSKWMRYRESWNVWAYHIALSKSTRGERQEIEQNYLFSIYCLWRTEKHSLWKRKLKLDLVFRFFPAANVFPHEHAWLLPCWTPGSGVLEAFLGREDWPWWQRSVRLGLFQQCNSTGMRDMWLSSAALCALCGSSDGCVVVRVERVHQTLPLRLVCVMLPWRPCQCGHGDLYCHDNIP